jgi:hypothetical protein
MPVAHNHNPSYSEAEIWRFEVRSQPGQVVRPYLEKTLHKRTGEVAQVVGSEFKAQYSKKKKKLLYITSAFGGFSFKEFAF